MFSNKPNYTKLRTNLRLCINRLKLLEKKKTELALKARKEIADYIAGGKEDRARIRVEHIVREDYLVEAMEIVEMLCDLLLARFGLIERMTELDAGIEEAVATIIWVTPRLCGDIQELREVSTQLTLKYSKEYADMCRRNEFEKVHEKVVHKMSLACPPKILVENYMIEIAKSYKVPFEPDPVIMMGEPPATNNLIDLGADSFSANGAAATASVASYPSGMNQPLYDNSSNMSAADRKRMEANGEQGPPNNTGRRPPSPPNSGGGGGGGGAFSYPPMGGGAGGGSKCEYNNYPGSVPVLPHEGQFQPPKPPRGGQTSSEDGQHFPPALPSRPPNSNHGSPETDSGQKPVPGMHRSPFNPTMSMLDDDDEQLPSLPAYDAVINSPGQFPSPYPQLNNNHQPFSSGSNQQPTAPVPAPRGASNGAPRFSEVPTLPEVPGLPSVPANSVGMGSVGGDDVNFDDLTRRFEELKRRK